MAVSVFTAGMFKPMLKLVTPVIDLKNFVTYIYEEKTCAICGRKFRAKVYVNNANPSQGVCCSHACLSKLAFKNLGHLVDEKDFKKFVDSKRNIIEKTATLMYNDSRKNVNLSYENMISECYVALFYLYSRCMQKKRNPYLYKDAYIYTHLKRALMLNEKEKKDFYSSAEESFYEEDNDEFMSKCFNRTFDIDKKLDIENILRKIYNLALEDNDVKLVLEKALVYGTNKFNLEEGADFRQRAYEKYGYTERTIWHKVKKGTEHIFYNDAKNIRSYINIHNLKNDYAFNDARSKTLTEEEFGKELAALLDYYSGYTTCYICGKRFKPEGKNNTVASPKRKAICSKECRIKANRLRNAAYREKLRNKMANN